MLYNKKFVFVYTKILCFFALNFIICVFFIELCWMTISETIYIIEHHACIYGKTIWMPKRYFSLFFYFFFVSVLFYKSIRIYIYYIYTPYTHLNVYMLICRQHCIVYTYTIQNTDHTLINGTWNMMSFEWMRWK